jgi:hypothetical protein
VTAAVCKTAFARFDSGAALSFLLGEEGAKWKENEMQKTLLRLPDWPARRLLDEACFYYNLRHPAETIAERTAPWGRCVGAILAFLRHEFSDYDAELAGTFDPAKRDALAAEIAEAAYGKYRWLRRDPRETPEFNPVPAPDDARKPLDRRAARLAELRSFAQAVQRYLDSDCPPERRAEMERRLGTLRTRIDRDFDIFTPVDKESRKDFTKGDFRPTRTGADYDFFGYDLYPNRWRATEISCPACGQRVLQTKSPLDLGQGRRMHVLTCHCVTGIVVPPPPGKRSSMIITVEDWEGILKAFKEREMLNA